jgi:hypothetical protein
VAIILFVFRDFVLLKKVYFGYWQRLVTLELTEAGLVFLSGHGTEYFPFSIGDPFFFITDLWEIGRAVCLDLR